MSNAVKPPKLEQPKYNFFDTPYIEPFDLQKAYNEMMKKFEKRFKNEQSRKTSRSLSQ